DILTSETADTPARRIYLAVQLMYLADDITKHHDVYFELVRDFINAVPSSSALIAEVNNRILSGDLYKALKAAKAVIEYETGLLTNAQGS
ncbi:flagellar biosynthesis repressor FlbT, partial [Nostoc sp. NIES-2111]